MDCVPLPTWGEFSSFLSTLSVCTPVGLSLTFNLSFAGREVESFPLIFICENNRKSNKIMHCVDFILSGSFEDMGILHVFQLSFDGGVISLSITDR